MSGSGDISFLDKSKDFVQNLVDYKRDGWTSGFVVAIILVSLIILVIMWYKERNRPQEHNSNRDPLAEKIIFANQSSNPLETAILLDSIESFEDESDFEHLSDSNVYVEPEDVRQGNNELIDLLYA